MENEKIIILKNNLISHFKYNNMKNKTENSQLDEGVEVTSKSKRFRRTVSRRWVLAHCGGF